MAPTIYEMLANLAESLFSLTTLVQVFSYLMGLTLIIGALYKLRTFGDFRVMMFQGVDIKGPFGQIVFGAFLIWLPSSLQVTAATFWGVGEPIGYAPGNGDPLSEGIAVAMDIIRFVGLIAFIRGLMIMARLGQQSAQPGTMAKGLTHIVGGILAYHIGPTVDVIRNTLGIS
jgi:intracellular multiplication protein IcmC